MTIRDGVVVEASVHAIEAALKRIPVLKGCDGKQAERWVERTAARGVIAQRSARRIPRWAVRGKYRPGIGGEGVARFVWNEDENAVFLCRRTRMYRVRRGVRTDLGHGWLVVTVIARPESA